jgi:hypothetical protein
MFKKINYIIVDILKINIDQTIIAFIVFLFWFSVGAIFLDSAPFPEENLIDFIHKENDFDVYYGFGSKRFQCLAEKVDALDLKSRRR